MSRNEYKQSLAGVGPTAKTVDEIINISYEKKANKNNFIKRVACAALSIILVVGSSFGINYAVKNSKNDLNVMVVYAYDNKSLLFASKSNQKLFYGIYTAPLDNEKACDEVRSRWQKDKSKLNEWIDNERVEDESASILSGSEGCYSTKLGKETAVLYTLNAGNIELSLEDYSQVKSFKVENESQYGYLEFDYCSEEDYQEYYDTLEKTKKSDGENIVSETSKYSEDYEITQEDIMRDFGWAHKFELTGDELRFSQESGFYIKGVGKYEENKGYFLNWTPSFELKEAIGNNPNFDLSQIVDTITFTVEYNDGTVKTASLDLHFDSDGYMKFDK